MIKGLLVVEAKWLGCSLSKRGNLGSNLDSGAASKVTRLIYVVTALSPVRRESHMSSEYNLHKGRRCHDKELPRYTVVSALHLSELVTRHLMVVESLYEASNSIHTKIIHKSEQLIHF